MGKINSIKKYITWFTIWLSLVVSIWYAANSGSIGELFQIVNNDSNGTLGNSYRLNWANIADNTVTNAELDNSDNYTVNSMTIKDNKISRLYNNAISIDSSHNTQSSIIFRSDNWNTVAWQVAATSQSIGFLKPWQTSNSFAWLLKVIKSTGNIWIWTITPSAKLEVNWNVIADNPTQGNHLATKAYVDQQISAKKDYNLEWVYMQFWVFKSETNCMVNKWVNYINPWDIKILYAKKWANYWNDIATINLNCPSWYHEIETCQRVNCANGGCYPWSSKKKACAKDGIFESINIDETPVY